MQGRPLKAGDQLPLGKAAKTAVTRLSVPQSWRPSWKESGSSWEVGVLPGPNAEPDYFTPEDIAAFYKEPYRVHYNS